MNNKTRGYRYHTIVDLLKAPQSVKFGIATLTDCHWFTDKGFKTIEEVVDHYSDETKRSTELPDRIYLFLCRMRDTVRARYYVKPTVKKTEGMEFSPMPNPLDVEYSPAEEIKTLNIYIEEIPGVKVVLNITKPNTQHEIVSDNRIAINVNAI